MIEYRPECGTWCKKQYSPKVKETAIDETVVMEIIFNVR